MVGSARGRRSAWAGRRWAAAWACCSSTTSQRRAGGRGTRRRTTTPRSSWPTRTMPPAWYVFPHGATGVQLKSESCVSQDIYTNMFTRVADVDFIFPIACAQHLPLAHQLCTLTCPADPASVAQTCTASASSPGAVAHRPRRSAPTISKGAALRRRATCAAGRTPTAPSAARTTPATGCPSAATRRSSAPTVSAMARSATHPPASRTVRRARTRAPGSRPARPAQVLTMDCSRFRWPSRETAAGTCDHFALSKR